MTPNDYRLAGFEMSLQIDPAVVARAEDDVMQAYILPILPTAKISDKAVKDALMNLAFLLVLKRSVKATRSGAKVKTGANSSNADGWDALSEQATISAAKLKVLCGKAGAVKKPKVTDICGLFFASNYLYNDLTLV